MLGWLDSAINLDSIRQRGPAMIWMTSAEALRALGVLPQTLYANVSRGKIRAKPDAADPRRRLYHRDDVLRMARRANGRRKVETVAAQAIEWGDPVLPSAISTVVDGRLSYRGQDAVALSQAASFERVAALLWDAPDDVFAGLEDEAAVAPAAATALGRGLAEMARRCDTEPPTAGRPPADLRAQAARVHRGLAHAMLASPPPASGSLAAWMAAAWRRPAAEDALRRALVLLADHELNASTFAARVAISTGASLSAGVLAGLAALSGPLHGRSMAPIRAMLAAARDAGPAAALRAFESGDPPRPPGFGHPLYPQGDARAAAVLAVSPLPALHARLARLAEQAHGEKPNIDFALVALADAYDLPADAPFIVFALARCAGWLAHALEQAGTGRLIRPRARYVGLAPRP
jgi:citrate synthase